MDQENIQNTPPVRPPETPSFPQDYSLNLDDFDAATGFWARLKARFSFFFADKRKVLVFSAILVLLAGGLIAYFASKNGDVPVSKAPAVNRERLPIAGQAEPDFLPTVYRPGDGTIVVEWAMPTPTDGRGDYGTSQNYGYFADDPETLHPSAYRDTHRVVLEDLDPSITYNLLASSADNKGKFYF